jgi:energy-coupling factor transport system ATP-binding protein
MSLEVHNVWFGYTGEPVIRGVSLNVDPGETVALLGHNGAGKTTLTRMIMGLLKPARGEIRVAGIPTRNKAPEDVAAVAAYVFQHSDQQLFARSVLNEVMFAPRQMGAGEAEARSLAIAALHDVGLVQRADVHPYDLPSPERKIVALAAALAQRPQVLVLDEPTQGLDAGFRRRVLAVLGELSSRGVAVLLVSQDLGFVVEIADRAVVLTQGRIVADLPPRDLAGDEKAAKELGFTIPPAARLAQSLGLPGKPARISEVIEALRRR